MRKGTQVPPKNLRICCVRFTVDCYRPDRLIHRTDDDVKTVTQLIHRMKDEGYLYLHDENRVALVNSAEQAEIRRLEYLNPMALIKVYVGYESDLVDFERV